MTSIFKDLKSALVDKFITKDSKEYFEQMEEDRLIDELSQEDYIENPFYEKAHCTKCGEEIMGDEDGLCGKCAN